MGDWLQLLLRLLHYAFLLGLFGLTAFATLALRQIAGAQVDVAHSRFLSASAMIAPVIAAALMLVSIAAMMGQPVWLLEWATIKAMLLTTSMGHAVITQIVLLIVAAGALWALPSPTAMRFAAPFYALALFTLAWSGHAAATEALWGLFHKLSDGLHLVAAGLWIGAIGWFVRMAFITHRTPEQIAPEELLTAMHRFAPLGVSLVAIVAITGLINVQMIFGLFNSGAVLETRYGWLLAIKLVFVGVMLLCAARNAMLARRRLCTGESASATLARVRLSLAAELLSAFAILGLVAVLGMASPMD
ncbi:MAG: CopD family protein [Sphingorhabdus sp.]